jgi:hypothetical protein
VIDKIDLLHVDTEGHDYRILRQLDFARFSPALVIYEHKHLTTEERIAARQLLQSRGYRLREHSSGDAIAWCTG